MSEDFLKKQIELINENAMFIYDYAIKYEKEIERLNNIIKEVREYIKENYPTSTINYQEDKYKLLEILDKVEENK